MKRQQEDACIENYTKKRILEFLKEDRLASKTRKQARQLQRRTTKRKIY